MKSVNWPKPGYASITCSTISNSPYNLIFSIKFNDYSILATIILYDYLNLSLGDEHVGDVTIQTQVIEYNQNFLQTISQSDWNIQIKLNYSHLTQCEFYLVFRCTDHNTDNHPDTKWINPWRQQSNPDMRHSRR